MEYDPIKSRIAAFMKRRPWARRLFFSISGMLFLREWYVRRALRRLSEKKIGSILDAGAGFGQHSHACLVRFPQADILAVDSDPRRAEDFAGSPDGRLRYETRDIACLDFVSRFDLILCIDVLEHISDDQAVLRGFCRALRPDGVLLVSTPALYRKHGRDSGFVGEHFREGYSHEEILAKFGAAGFRLDRIEYGYGFWGDASWRLGIRNTMRILGKGRAWFLPAALYLIIVFPFVFLGMLLDYSKNNKRGTGVLIQANKPADV